MSCLFKKTTEKYLFIRDNGIYYIRYTENKKRPKLSLNTKDKSEAMRLYYTWLDCHKTARLTGTVTCSLFSQKLMAIQGLNPELAKKIETQSKPISFSTTYNEYLDTSRLKNLAATSIKLKEKLFSLYQNKTMGLGEISQSVINHLYHMLSKEYKESYVSKLMQEMKSFINYCVKKGYISGNPYDFYIKKIRATKPPIEQEEMDIIFQYLENQNNIDFLLYLKTLYETGSRPGEIVCLKISDFDFINHSVSIYQNKVKKTKMVPISTNLSDTILKYIHDNYLQTTVFSGNNKGLEYYSKQIKKLKKVLYLRKEIILYSFRHARATDVVNRTGDIHCASQILGHSNTTITEKQYVHRNVEDLRSTVYGNK